MDSTTVPAALLTFPPMIDSELSRFVLNHYGVAYREEPHIFGWASILALFRGGTVQIPLFSGKGASLAGPRAMVDHFETNHPIEKRLIPANSVLSTQVEADWYRFNGILAGATAVLGYYHLLPHRAIMIEPFCRGVPKIEASMLTSNYSVFAGLFKLLLQLNAMHARDALTQTRAIFDETDRRLADGRQYLVGDYLTLSDIALATAAAPVLLPEGYGSPMPPIEHMPSQLQAIISEMRQHETARFVEKIFRNHRQNSR
jgi:glutathione S-transferase